MSTEAPVTSKASAEASTSAAADGPEVQQAAKAAAAAAATAVASTTKDTTIAKPATTKSKPTPAAPASSAAGGSSFSVEDAVSVLEEWVGAQSNNKNKTADAGSAAIAKALRVVLKDHDALREKIGKLKSLLGRSAKAQREAKMESEATQKKLEALLQDRDRLVHKVEHLSNRPTHMELLQDFETNFDRALLAMGQQQQQQQAGGESSAPPGGNGSSNGGLALLHPSSGGPNAGSGNGAGDNGGHSASASDTVVDHLLLQELNDSKQRIEKLENLNAALLHRSSQLESEAQDRRRERDDLHVKVTTLELEKRMAVMEAEHATKALQEKSQSLSEMQLEIDLVTKASVSANVRAAQGEQLRQSVQTDRKHVHELETKVQALQEWALAATEAKTLSQERVRLLEAQLKALKRQALQQGAPSHRLSDAGKPQRVRMDSDNNNGMDSIDLDDWEEDGEGTGNKEENGLPNAERTLWQETGSLVVGAGDVGLRTFTLEDEDLTAVASRNGGSGRLVLRWQFDLTTAGLNVEFSVIQGQWQKTDVLAKKLLQAHGVYLIQDRMVQNGAGGDVEKAFEGANRTCTLVWSNVKSWVRPRTIRYTIQAVLIQDAI